MHVFPNTAMAVHSAMNDTVEAVVLSWTDYRENDAIIHVLTPQYGKMAFVCQGVRKVSSKNGRNIQPCTHCSILYDHKENRSMQKMRTASVLHMFRHMKENLQASIGGSLICEAVESLMEEGEPAKEVWDALLDTLQHLDQGEHTDTMICAFLAQMLSDLGFGLHVDGCVMCDDTKVTAFSVNEGGFVCQRHMHKANIAPWDLQDLRRFRLINKAGIKHIDILLNSTEAKRQDVDMLVQVIRRHTGAPLKSYDLYRRI